MTASLNEPRLSSTPGGDAGVAAPTLEATHSEGFGHWLQQQQLSLAFTTYQTNRLFCLGTTQAGKMALHERLFDKPMGLFAQDNRLYMSTRYQIWQLDNLLRPGELRQGCDLIYTPKLAHTTGDLNVHDVVIDASGELLFVNTDFNCLARLSPDYSFVPQWRPPFISKWVAEDRCHLNGLALREGKPAYMTACSSTNTAASWRHHRVDGGVVMDIQANEVIATGLSMPHSPRWYRGKLWLLNSGTGELGHIDFDSGAFVPLTFCPGFVRGMTFCGNVAVIGLSKLRSKSFTGLALEKRLTAAGDRPHCGLMVVDLETGNVLHWLRLEGVVEELFDVVVLPNVRQPQSLGFQSDEIERLVTFPEAEGIVVTKPTVKRPSLAGKAPVAGVPRTVWDGQSSSSTASVPSIAAALDSLKFQHVYHLTPENLADYDDFTFPRLRQRWSQQPQRGEMLGVSASVEGDMVAFGVAELLPDQSAEVISLWVTPEYRQQRIGQRLMAILEQKVCQEGCTKLLIAYEATALTQIEPLLKNLGWQALSQNHTQHRWHKNFAPQLEKEAPHPFEQGKAFAKQGDLDAAIACFTEALRQRPDHLAAYNQLGNAYQQLGQTEDAIATYQALLERNPNVAQAHANLGAIWQIQGKTGDAIASYQTAIALKPDLTVAHLNLAKLHATAGQQKNAAVHYQAALAADPQQVEAHYGLAKVSLTQDHLEQANACFRQVLKLQPEHSAALLELGFLSEAQGQLAVARACYQKLFNTCLEWQHLAAYQLSYVRRQLCNWQHDDARMTELLQRLETHIAQTDSPALAPLSLSVFPASPALHRAVNEHHAAQIQRRMAETKERCHFQHPQGPVDKLRIGYVSPDFRNHPVGWLMQDLFQYHDRDRFEIFAYSLRHAEDSVQANIEAGCDHFIDCSQLLPEESAHRIHADGIHILIDLAGYTTYSRPEIFALRPAPIQCSYLGYPDTTGSESIDYLITDEWVVPPALAAHCTEQVVYLPHQFVVSPTFAESCLPKAEIDQEVLKQGNLKQTRQDYGLPAKGFVFCCFNLHRKIEPTVFSVWMKILQQVPNSVLWLSDGPDPVKVNLRQAAQAHGVAAERLIFAPRLPFDEYLARYQFADLFLDTFSYGAGSTAICALSAGVPLLTHPGETNASRMGASICAAAGLEDLLICDSILTYEQRAVHLATHAEEMATLRQKLRGNRSNLPLFQPQQWISHWEETLEKL
ncbi:Lipopolysaccharide assembly protein B [Acaryochloris thomasi RCC1774]|uniref:protein O-GlcNAc transferase n=1 Tax=Acaryochloris thomasi RCC1774 TaxID=1764569 RepID=A0A2W1K4U3_9CYAN|nr:TIGR03032 family protein [Acaryochloris thomasi]PZD74981.1 Lipopolysaccharide assembly protein B [Acaryochloris thomasi RCC1774]